MYHPKILAFGGSLRAASYNQQAAAMVAAAAREAGAEVTLIALRDYPLPLFDQDLETSAGMPQNAGKLKELFLGHDGLIIASPEYNSTISAALKNAIDWVSRATAKDEAPLVALAGKTAAILAASPGGYGGSRGLAQLRPFLENIRITVIEPQVTIPKAHEVITADGTFADETIASSLRSLGLALVTAMQARANA
jgi:chromate reductase